VTTQKPTLRITLSLIIGLITFGFAAIMVRLADGDPIAIVMVRTVGAVLILLPFYLMQNGKPKSVLSPKEKALFILAGVCLGLHFLLWTASLSYTTVASASVLVCIHPILMIIAERVLHKVKFGWAVWLGVILSFIGSALLGLSDQQTTLASNPLLGNLMAFSAAVVVVIYILLGQQLRKKTEWLEYVFPVYAWSALVCIILFWVSGASLKTTNEFWIYSLALALGPQLLGHGAMNYAVKYVQPTLLSMSILVEPILATLVAMMLFSEVPTIGSFLAMGLIVFGLMLAWFSRIRELRSA
jgi:drug/metabolite transporter (DMT)-like permease